MEHAQVIKQVSGYGADEWEIFTREWGQGLAKKEGYHEVKRLGGAGDHGRDVIGLCSPSACAGVWDNYQCKNYGGMLQTPKACEDAGKIIFHAFRGFSPRHENIALSRQKGRRWLSGTCCSIRASSGRK